MSDIALIRHDATIARTVLGEDTPTAGTEETDR